jgi:hypothetical protein
MVLSVGGIAGRTLHSGLVYSQVLNIAAAADIACQNAGSPMTSSLTPWTGTAVKTPSTTLTPTGCNQ